MNEILDSIEIDFVEFMASRESRPMGEIEKQYRRMRRYYGLFKNKKFSITGAGFHNIYSLFYRPDTAERTIALYQHLAPLHLLNFISNVYPKNFSARLRDAWEMLKSRQYKEIWGFGGRYFNERVLKKNTPELIIEHTAGNPVIVDYGCGMACLSSAIAQLNKSTKIYLVDIDTIILEFTIFRFEKYKFNYEVINVTKDNFYPALPEHNICIANEVMEHVLQPLKVYANISLSMVEGGLLYGNFLDHSDDLLHISSNLSSLRKTVSEDYKCIETKMYKKLSNKVSPR